MTPLEQLVSSFALSKRLKELGVDQHCRAFYWAKLKAKHLKEQRVPFLKPGRYLYFRGYYALTPADSKDLCYIKRECNYENEHDLVAALTDAELGEMLPCSAGYGPIEFYNDFAGPRATAKVKMCIVREGGEGKFREFTEADARAKMLIHLIEKGIVKA